MLRTIIYCIAGYISGSILYANLFFKLFGKEELLAESADRNPGTANAFKYGGIKCGTLTLLCDLMKGFLPVYLYTSHSVGVVGWDLTLVLAAPVIGHIFPLAHKFHGGKGIAATFGCLLGLTPYLTPVILFAGFFVFLSVGLRISPHFYRTAAAYICTLVAMPLFNVYSAILVSFFVITMAVLVRLYRSKETKEKLEVKLLWMR